MLSCRLALEVTAFMGRCDGSPCHQVLYELMLPLILEFPCILKTVVAALDMFTHPVMQNDSQQDQNYTGYSFEIGQPSIWVSPTDPPTDLNTFSVNHSYNIVVWFITKSSVQACRRLFFYYFLNTVLVYVSDEYGAGFKKRCQISFIRQICV